MQSILRDSRRCFIGEFDERDIFLGGDSTDFDETGVSGVSIDIGIESFGPWVCKPGPGLRMSATPRSSCAVPRSLDCGHIAGQDSNGEYHSGARKKPTRTFRTPRADRPTSFPPANSARTTRCSAAGTRLAFAIAVSWPQEHLFLLFMSAMSFSLVFSEPNGKKRRTRFELFRCFSSQRVIPPRLLLLF